MSDSIPKVTGPKLFPFDGDLEDAEFIKILNLSEGIHGRVFKIAIKDKRYALKVFNFVSILDLWPTLFFNHHLVTEKTVRHHLDPFFAECRAFGLLTKEGKDHKLAVRCHGYVFLSKSVERRIRQQFRGLDWNRAQEDRDQPLRAIVKDYIRYKSFYKPSNFSLMRKKLQELNGMGIYNMDVRKENYLGGRLFDFSTAVTIPHMSFSLKLRTPSMIMGDIRYDRACFDHMVEPVVEEIELNRKQRLDSHRSGFKKGKGVIQETTSTETEPRTRL